MNFVLGLTFGRKWDRAPVRELHEAYHEEQAIHNGTIVEHTIPHVSTCHKQPTRLVAQFACDL